MIFISPLSVRISATRGFSLNLNIYRNSHYQILNKAKKSYKSIMTHQMLNSKSYRKCYIEYKLFPKTKRLCDIGNILSIHDKFFCDAMVDLGKLVDDNYKIVPKIFYCMGEVDKDNPRVEIIVTEID